MDGDASVAAADEVHGTAMTKFGAMVHYVTTERLDVFTKRMEVVGIGEQLCRLTARAR